MRKSIFAIALATLPAAAGAFDTHDSRGGALGRGVLLTRPTAMNLVNVATGSLTDGATLFEAGYFRRYELRDLDYLFLAGAWTYRRITVAVSASQFGRTDLYAEQLLKGNLVFHYRRLSLGSSLSALKIQIGDGYGGLQAATIGLTGSLSSSKFTVALASDNLTQPTMLEGGTPYQSTHTLFAEYHGVEAFSFTGRLRGEKGQKPQFGLGQAISLSHRSEFFWGVGTAPVEYGGGIEIDIPFGSVTYVATVHPVLGLSHTVTLAYKSRREHKEGDDFD